MTLLQTQATKKVELPPPVPITDKTIFTDDYKGYLKNLGNKDEKKEFIVTPTQLANLKEAVKKFIGVKSEFEIGIAANAEGSALFPAKDPNVSFLNVSVHSPQSKNSDDSKKFQLVIKYDSENISAVFANPKKIEVAEHAKFSVARVTDKNINVGNAIFNVMEKHKDHQLSFAGTSPDGSTFIVTAPTVEAASKLPKDFENHDRLFILKGNKLEEMKVLDRDTPRGDSGFSYSFKNSEGRTGNLSFPGMDFNKGGALSGTPDVVILNLHEDKAKALPREEIEFKPIR